MATSQNKASQKWRQDEILRRRTERGRQRSEMMEQRKQGAQTQYLQRQANKAEWKSEKGRVFTDNTVERRRYAVRQMPDQAVNAIAMGETQRQYVTAQDHLDTAETAREAALITAKSPEAVQGIKTEGEKYVVNAEQYGLNARQKRELDLQKEQYVAPGVYKDEKTDKIVTVGGAEIYDEPQEAPTGEFKTFEGGRQAWVNPDGTVNWLPQEEYGDPIVTTEEWAKQKGEFEKGSGSEQRIFVPGKGWVDKPKR